MKQLVPITDDGLDCIVSVPIIIQRQQRHRKAQCGLPVSMATPALEMINWGMRAAHTRHQLGALFPPPLKPQFPAEQNTTTNHSRNVRTERTPRSSVMVKGRASASQRPESGPLSSCVLFWQIL